MGELIVWVRRKGVLVSLEYAWCGEEMGEIVAAVVVPSRPEEVPSAVELHGFCRMHLAPHKTPARWFQAGELPLTGSGQIQKFRLRDQIDRAELQELPSERHQR